MDGFLRMWELAGLLWEVIWGGGSGIALGCTGVAGLCSYEVLM